MTPQSPRDLFPTVIPRNDATPGMLIGTGEDPGKLITIRLVMDPPEGCDRHCLEVGVVDRSPNDIVRFRLGRRADSEGLRLVARTASELRDGKIPLVVDHKQEMLDGTQ